MAKSEQVSLQDLLIAISIKILSSIFGFCFIVSAVYVGIKISGEAPPAASPAPAVNHKAAPKKIKKAPKTGGTGAMNSEPSKTEEEDPGLGA